MRLNSLSWDKLANAISHKEYVAVIEPIPKNLGSVRQPERLGLFDKQVTFQINLAAIL
jgi:hypothetical protein